MYGSNGAACHDTQQDSGLYSNLVNSGFAKGDILTFTLDLTQASHDGELTVAIDKDVRSARPSPSVVVFQNMLTKLSFANEQEVSTSSMLAETRCDTHLVH